MTKRWTGAADPVGTERHADGWRPGQVWRSAAFKDGIPRTRSATISVTLGALLVLVIATAAVSRPHQTC